MNLNSDVTRKNVRHADCEGDGSVMQLIHTSDLSPGFRRKKAGKGFIYLDPDGNRLVDAAQLARIRSLVIPPAYQSVWICMPANGHLQATGRDARNRKQYRYHPEWRQLRDDRKFSNLLEFAEMLPGIRARLGELLRSRDIGKEQVAALALSIIDQTGARVGNTAYRDENGTYGITTLMNEHAEVNGQSLRLHYRGKHGKDVKLKLQSPALARRLARCQDLPGQDLFEYVNTAGDVVPLSSSDVNGLLRDIAGEHVTAKTFRTWRGSLIAFHHLLGCDPAGSTSSLKSDEVAAVRATAEALHNTMATARKYYVHPRITETWLSGEFSELVGKAKKSRAFAKLDDADESLFARFLSQK